MTIATLYRVGDFVGSMNLDLNDAFTIVYNGVATDAWRDLVSRFIANKGWIEVANNAPCEQGLPALGIFGSRQDALMVASAYENMAVFVLMREPGVYEHKDEEFLSYIECGLGDLELRD